MDYKYLDLKKEIEKKNASNLKINNILKNSNILRFY